MMRELELLAPASDIEVARQAILHGADAIYIGASSHGARRAAANSVDDIRHLVEFAHPFRVKIYVTVNTLVYDDEIRKVERLVRELYEAGVDALIVQDMALLRMDIPPIALHASTQCDTRTPEKARFLQDVGFSQIVLARELSLSEIRAVCSSVTVPVECFVHGALCVSYSGRCHASQACLGRSANRGECAQICRLPFTMTDARGNVLARDRHLLSLRDFNLSDRLPDLIEAGVSSFKIEGRLKDAAYVRNVTAAYRKALDKIIDEHPGNFRRSSCGVSEISFSPALAKSFNRGFTHYFIGSRRPQDISSPLTPKSMGEIVKPEDLHNGDGISFFNRNGEYEGVKVNKVENGRIMTLRNARIPKDAQLHRTYDAEWQRTMSRPTATRHIPVDIMMDPTGVTASDARGVTVRVPLDVKTDVARKPMDFRSHMARLGASIYRLDSFTCPIDESVFIPASDLAVVRQSLVKALDSAAEAVYHFDSRRPEDYDAVFPYPDLDYRDNVANHLADEFYRSHGVRSIEPAMEVRKGESRRGKEDEIVMTTRHCILREMGMCKKEGTKIAEPLTIRSGNNTFTLDFDCRACEMRLRMSR